MPLCCTTALITPISLPTPSASVILTNVLNGLAPGTYKLACSFQEGFPALCTCTVAGETALGSIGSVTCSDPVGSRISVSVPPIAYPSSDPNYQYPHSGWIWVALYMAGPDSDVYYLLDNGIVPPDGATFGSLGKNVNDGKPFFLFPTGGNVGSSFDFTRCYTDPPGIFTGAFITCPSLSVTSLTVDCSDRTNPQIVIAGTDFDSPTVELFDSNDNPVTFSLVSQTATEIVLNNLTPPFAPGEYSVVVTNA